MDNGRSANTVLFFPPSTIETLSPIPDKYYCSREHQKLQQASSYLQPTSFVRPEDQWRQSQLSTHRMSNPSVLTKQPPVSEPAESPGDRNSSQDDETPSPPENVKGGPKLARIRERNRISASKCREKRRVHAKSLESHARELNQRHSELLNTIRVLQDELFVLKENCLEHIDCNCERIRDYLLQLGSTEQVARGSVFDPVYQDYGYQGY